MQSCIAPDAFALVLHSAASEGESACVFGAESLRPFAAAAARHEAKDELGPLAKSPIPRFSV